MFGIALEQYREWEQICEKATKGPWAVKQDRPIWRPGNYVVSEATHEVICAEQDASIRTDDAVFIATSRTAFPNLLALYEESARQIEEMKEALYFYATATPSELEDDNGRRAEKIMIKNIDWRRLTRKN